MVKRFLATVTLVCVLLLGAVASPALSLRPWRSEPVDFSVAAPAGALLGEASARGAGVLSRPLRASKRFNLVGLTWVGVPDHPGIAIRTRTEGGAWSRWSALHAQAEDGPDPSTERDVRGTSAPTWVGEADWVQYRTNRRLHRLRIHFVNVRGDATAADRARTAVRRLTNSAVASVAGLARVGGARAGEPVPRIVPRSAWGAADCPPRTGADLGEVRAAFVHHTVNLNDYSREEAPDVVLGICRFHRNTNGWNDIGYNFLVDRFGTIYEGRAGGIDQAVVGAQAAGYNTQSTGVANLGTFSTVRQTPQALGSMARLIRWKLPLHGVPTAGPATLVSGGGSSNRYPAGRQVRLQRVIGHRDTGATSCPGEALYSQLPELRRLVGHLNPSGVAAQLRGRVTRRIVPFGRTVQVTGILTVPGRPPLARQAVQVEALIGRRWRAVAQATTGNAGDITAAIKPMRNRRLRLRYSGFGDLRPATSPTFTVGVRPLLTLSPMARAVARRSRVVVSGRVRPRKARVYQVLQERRGRRFRTVGTRAVKTRRDGRFRGAFVPLHMGSYRFYVMTRADRSTARAATRKFTLRVGRSRGGGTAGP